MPLRHYDLICSLGQLSNPLPRWTSWAEKGGGAANPFSPSLPVSVSLKGEGRRSPFPGCTHSPLLYVLRHSKATLSLFGSPGSSLLPPPPALGLFSRPASFLLHSMQLPQSSCPTEQYSLSPPRGFARAVPSAWKTLPSLYPSFLSGFLFQEVFLDSPQLRVPRMQGEHIGETMISS